jgi:hypothetical protein
MSLLARKKKLLMAAAGGAIELISYAQARNASGTTVAIDKPSGAATGDFLLAMIFMQQTGIGISSAPAGWGSEGSDIGNFPSVHFYSKFYGGEAGPYTWVAGAGTTIAGVIVALRGVKEVNTLGSFVRVQGLTNTADSISPTKPGALMAFYATHVDSSVDTPPSGMDMITSYSGANPSGHVFWQNKQPSGPTGTRTLVLSGSGNPGFKSRLIQLS